MTTSELPIASSILTTFDALPAKARVWVFAANRPIGSEERSAIAEIAEKFFHVWKQKEPLIKGCCEFREDRFFVVGSDETAGMLSGCSVDAMTSWLMKLEARLGLKLIDRMMVHYRAADGSVASASRPAFKALVKSGEVSADTLVFDTAISRVESLREGLLELPLRDSWHAQLFLS